MFYLMMTLLLKLCIITLCRPPPNLLRLEMEGTKLYLAILLRSSAESEIKEEKQEKWSLGPKNIEMVIREEQKLKVEAERRLVAFYVQILEEVVLLQPKPSAAVPFNTHRSLEMRAPITVLVLTKSPNLSLFQNLEDHKCLWFCKTQMEEEWMLCDLDIVEDLICFHLRIEIC